MLEKGDWHGRRDSATLGMSLNQVGYCHFQLNEFALAIPWFECAVVEQTMGDIHRRLVPGWLQKCRLNLSFVSASSATPRSRPATSRLSAKLRFAESLAIVRKLAEDNSNDAEIEGALGSQLDRLGDLAVQSKDVKDAKARYAESLRIARKLSKDNPTSAVSKQRLCVALAKFGKAGCDRTLLREALKIARALEKAGGLAPSHHDMPDRVRAAIKAIK